MLSEMNLRLLLVIVLSSRPALSSKHDSTMRIVITEGHIEEESTLTNFTNATTQMPFNLLFKSDTYNLAFYRNLPEYKAYLFFRKYFVYFTSVPGLVTNPLSVFVALKSRPTTTSDVHMLTLGLTDTCVVSTRITLYLLQFYNFQWTDIACKTIYYVNNTPHLFSNLIVVSWTIERFIVIVFPLKMSARCTVLNVKELLLLLLVLSCLVLIPQIAETHTVRISNKTFCSYSKLYYSTYAMIGNFIYMYVPVIIVIVCNFVIVVKVQQASKIRTVYTSDQNVLSKRLREQRQMTKMLIIIACAFLILHFSQVLATIWEALYSATEIFLYSVRNYIYFLLFTLIGYMITDFQNSINFFLYCAFGTKVRKVLHKTFYCRKLFA